MDEYAINLHYIFSISAPFLNTSFYVVVFFNISNQYLTLEMDSIREILRLSLLHHFLTSQKGELKKGENVLVTGNVDLSNCLFE